ncbi:MAG: EamA family transporter [Firmicutes bacterium]|nr:EamA family transporter [Bacillota bacterium]
MDKGSRATGHLMAFICSFFWGTAFIASKVMVSGDFAPNQIIVTRVALAFLILTLVTRKYVPLGGLAGVKRDRWLIPAGFLGAALYYLLESTAMQYTYATNVSLIVATSPLFSTVFDRFLPAEDRKPLSRSFFYGLALCLIGVTLVILNGSRLRLNPTGDFIALLASITWAAYSFCVNKAQRVNEAQPEPLSQLLFTRRVMFYGLLLLIVVFLCGGAHYDPAMLRGRYLAVLLYLSALPSALCYWLWSRVISRIGMLNASLYVDLTTLIAALAGVVLLHEELTLMSASGMIAIIIGLIITQGFLNMLRRRS